MAIRKHDEWQLWMNYGQVWEHETSEDSYKAARAQQQTYRKNVPQYASRILHARVEVNPSGPVAV